MEELRVLDHHALGDIPSHRGRKRSLKEIIKHIDLIYWDSWSVDGVDRKAVMQS